MLRVLLVSISLLCLQISYAADKKKPETIPSIKQGKVVWLGQDKQKFLSIYQTENPKADIAIILFHDQLGDPNEPNFIGPIRRSLAKLKWPTLSISLTSQIKNNLQRLKLAQEYLKKQGIKKFIFLGYGFGGELVSQYLQDMPLKDLLAIVLVSAYPTKINAKTVKKLSKKALPILDITAMSDFNIAKTAAKKRLALNISKDNYRHLVVTGADHYYNQLDDMLAKKIHSWLRRQTW